MKILKQDKTQRVCKLGHRYYKSSDCPVCPKCEVQNNSISGFLKGFSSPARRALETLGISNLEKLSTFSRKGISNLHGIGPAVMKKLDRMMADADLKYKDV